MLVRGVEGIRPLREPGASELGVLLRLVSEASEVPSRWVGAPQNNETNALAGLDTERLGRLEHPILVSSFNGTHRLRAYRVPGRFARRYP